MKTETPIGLQIHTSIEQKHENSPHIFRFTYMLNDIKFKQWVKDHEYLTEGTVVTFAVKGINIWLVGKAGGEIRWDKAGFMLNLNDDGIQVVLPLLRREVVFVVHRDPISRKDWTVLLENPQAALPEK